MQHYISRSSNAIPARTTAACDPGLFLFVYCMFICIVCCCIICSLVYVMLLIFVFVMLGCLFYCLFSVRTPRSRIHTVLSFWHRCLRACLNGFQTTLTPLYRKATWMLRQWLVNRKSIAIQVPVCGMQGSCWYMMYGCICVYVYVYVFSLCVCRFVYCFIVLFPLGEFEAGSLTRWQARVLNVDVSYRDVCTCICVYVCMYVYIYIYI